MKFKCIIFDCDGVLVDSEATSIGVIVDLAAEMGYSMNLEEAIAEFSGHSLQYCFEYIEEASSQKFPPNIANIYRERSFEAFEKTLKPIPGIHQVLERLTLPRCVASNAPQDKIRLNLGLLELTPFFGDNIFSAYDIQKWKPEPDLFLLAAKTMGFEPKDCLVVEDSLAGVLAAKAGGFEVMGYASARTASQLEKAGATIFYDMNLLDSFLV
jgi:HAD superfamily hydrolase (TIGR01509 family)